MQGFVSFQAEHIITKLDNHLHHEKTAQETQSILHQDVGVDVRTHANTQQILSKLNNITNTSSYIIDFIPREFTTPTANITK